MSPNQLLLKFAARSPALIGLTMVLGFSGAIFNGVSVTLVVPILLSFLGQEINLQGAPPVIQKSMAFFDGFEPDVRLALLTGMVLLAIGLKNLATYASVITSSFLSRRLTRDLRKEALRLLLEVDLAFYAQIRIGDLVNRVGEQVNRTAAGIRSMIDMVTTTITILVFVALLLSISWQLTLASSVLLAVMAVINQIFIGRAREFGRILSKVSGVYSARLIEVLNGIRTIRASGTEDREYAKVETLIQEREKIDFKSSANYAAIGPINEMTGIITVFAIVFLGRVFFAEQLVSLSTVLLTYLFVLFRTLPLISSLNNIRSQFANFSSSTEVVADLLRRDNKPFMANGQVPYETIREGIRFENLSFQYPSGEGWVLQDVTLDLPRGTTLALVGASGAGKSTLADLLPRFYDPQEGRILIDGVDLRDYELRSLRRGMGIVSQDTFLFNDTVRNNIAYAADDATESSIIEAAKRANAYEFIQKLPQGFDTKLGDRGILLSGGQRQRIAIARALLRNPEILILDEATSALDTVSERLVQEAIDELSRNRTILVIAHRLSTIQKADQIAVMDQGRVVEIGNHHELLQRNGYYTRLHRMQFSGDNTEAIKAARETAVMELSYQARTQLNGMLGSLKLIVDGMADTPEEQEKLTEEAYFAAIALLKNLESIELRART